MANSYGKAKGRRESGAYVPMPCAVLSHQNFKKLTGTALRMLLELCGQLRFKQGGTVNNGDLCATLSVFRENGWTSNESIDFAIRELLYYGFINITRQGGRNKCSLYAITWWAIDECKGKLDSGFGKSSAPSGEWKELKAKWKRPKRIKKLKVVPRISSFIEPYNGVVPNNKEKSIND